MPTFNQTNVRSSPARVAVTAAGVISPLGSGLCENLEGLRAGRDSIMAVRNFDVSQCRCKTAGQISEAALGCSRNRKDRRLHRATRMLISALQELLQQEEDFDPDLVVIGTTSGGMSFGQKYYRALQQNGSARQCPAWIANYPAQKPVADALFHLGISAPSQVIANACASGTNAIGHAFEAIRSRRHRRVLTGGYDAISELVFVGFDTLQAATPEKCRPFDRDRSGMVLGEGAALLALENLDSARQRGARVLAEVVGYGISTDNHHLTQPHPSGAAPREAMRRALAQAETRPEQVDYINAHGTATPFNDAAEAKAIAELFGPSVPTSSTKSLMGHSLGAAGAIEAVFCLLALQNQFLPPNINFRQGDGAADLNIIANHSRPAALNLVLSNSFGFGGTNASILMQRASA